jgi:hypothetical protein
MGTSSFTLLFTKKYYLLGVILFMALLGSHMLDNRIYLFAIVAFFLVDWKSVDIKSSLLAVFYIVAIYIIWILLDKDVIFKADVAIKIISELSLIILLYLLGASIDVRNIVSSTKGIKIFSYLLFSFFITYSVAILYSYYTIDQGHSMIIEGLFVCFPNEYQRLNVNGGRLISTIISYYLTVVAALLAYVSIYIDKLKKRKIFNYYEIIFIVLLSLLSFYIAILLGRRITIILFITVFLVLILIRIIYDFSNKERVSITAILFVLLVLIYHFFAEELKEVFSYMYYRFHHKGLNAVRITYWIPGLQAMLDYPFGGGHGVFVGHKMKLAHNTWIDIGKDFGIIPFVLFLLFAVVHLYYFIKVMLFSKLERLIKLQLLVVMMTTLPTSIPA